MTDTEATALERIVYYFWPKINFQLLLQAKCVYLGSAKSYLQELLELTPKKDVLFIIGDWNAKVGSQQTPGVTGKFGLGVRNEAGQRLIEFCRVNALVIANTLFQQHKRRLYTWTSPDGQHWNQIDYILCSQRRRSSIQSTKTRPGADCGSDHELLIAKFRLKLKKVGETARPFRYDLNQIPYDYTVEVRNRFKGLDLIRVSDEVWTEVHDTVQETGMKTIPMEKKCKKPLHIWSNDSDKVLRPFSGDRTVLSINGAGKTGYPMHKNESGSSLNIIHKN